MGAYTVKTRDALGNSQGHFATLEAASEAFGAQCGYLARHSELHPAIVNLTNSEGFIYGVYVTQGVPRIFQEKA